MKINKKINSPFYSLYALFGALLPGSVVEVFPDPFVKHKGKIGFP